MKSKYEMDSPEWQLLQRVIAGRHEAADLRKTSEEKLIKASLVQEKTDRYRDALLKLDPEFVED